MRFLIYSGNGLVDANLHNVPALHGRLRLMARRRREMAGAHVLVFHTETDRYLGRRDIIIDDGEPVLVCPEVGF